jgi:hypothetical protein
MRKTGLFIAGIAVGVLLARQIETNPEAKKAIEAAGEKVRTFANAVQEGYREQETKNKKSKSAK